MSVHPLVERVREALERPGPADEDYLALLAARLERLRGLAAGTGPEGREDGAAREVALRFLRPRAGSWHDGDENLVRGFLDGFTRAGEDPRRAAAQGLLAAADRLAALEAPRGTLWFYLWELESVLAGGLLGRG